MASGRNGHAFAVLNGHIARVRALGRLPERVAPIAAKALDTEIRKGIDAGTGPDGKAWALTKAGGRALKHAGDVLTVRAVGTVIVATIVGPTVLHHLGKAAGRITRRVLPTRRAPAPVVRALKAAAADIVAGRA